MVEPADVRRVIERTEIRDVRLDEVHAGPVAPLSDSLVARLTRYTPEFLISDEPPAVLVRIVHSVDYVDSEDTGDDPGSFATIRVTHVAHFDLLGSDPLDMAALSAWIDTNVYFMVYPYVRATLQTLANSLSLPPLVLGYLKRDSLLLPPGELDEVSDQSMSDGSRAD